MSATSNAESANFAFLRSYDERLVRLGALAERYYADDPTAALIKLRQLGELLAKDVAARHAQLPDVSVSFDDVLRVLKSRGILPREVTELFYHLKRAGNAAAHEDVGSPGDALLSLKIARAMAIWFHQSYGNAPQFKPGPFIPPAQSDDTTSSLRKEIEELRAAVAASNDTEAKARLAAQDAEAATRSASALIDELEQQRAFWEKYAADTEVTLRQTQLSLSETNLSAQSISAKQLDVLADLAARQADAIDLDEGTTRTLIDEQLRSAGWVADSSTLRYANGTRPEAGQFLAIAEWPTASGPVDYALFLGRVCVGVIEAKREAEDVPGHLGQSKRYARDIKLAPDELLDGSPWKDGTDLFVVPFLFATNSRPYVKQLATKSGIWFWDARTVGTAPRPIAEWFSPRDLQEKIEQELASFLPAVADRELGISGLRPYQREAIAAVEDAITAGQRHILLAMATGTGKTRVAIALMYELLRAKRFRRILFLVDRNALGRQTLDALSNTETAGLLNFDQVFPIADLKSKFPEATDRVQVATVQSMISRVFQDAENGRPSPGTFDLIIVDEAHRGYTLDAELRGRSHI